MSELTKEQKQFKKMTESPVCPLVLRLALPTTVSMLVTGIYNTADTLFVSNLGKSPSAAVGVVFSLMALIQAVGFTLGMGCGSIVSRSLGKKDTETAGKVFSTSFFSALFIGILITIFGNIFIEPLMNRLGATPTSLPYAKQYARYILFGAPVMMGSYVLNNIWRWEGKAVFSMFGIGLGGIINIILDPIFITTMGLGISGAAIATLLSQSISFVLLFMPIVFKKNVSRLSLKLFSRDVSIHTNIWFTGLPSLLRQGLASLSTIFLNLEAGRLAGDAALSAMGIFGKVFMLIFCFILGIGQGYQPVLGYNYGAKKWKRVKTAFIFTYIFSTTLMIIFGIILFITAPYIMPLFIKDGETIAIGTRALRLEAVVMPLLTANVMCNMTFQSLGQRFKASFLSCLRQGVFFIPCVLLLPYFWKIHGVEAIYPVSDVLTFLTSVPFALKYLDDLTKGKLKGQDGPIE